MGRPSWPQNRSLASRSRKKEVKEKRKLGPRIPASLQRELNQKTHEEAQSDEEVPGLQRDVYEYEENNAPEESSRNRRYDGVDRLEYELPSDFEDEEIDEGAASGEDGSNQLKDRHSRKKMQAKDSGSGRRKKVMNLHSEEEEEEEEEEDNSDEGGLENDEHTYSRKTHYSASFEDDDDDEEEAEEEEEESLQHAEESERESDDEAGDERHRRMIEAVSGNRFKDPHEKKVKKNALLCEAYPESEFNVNPSSTGGPSSQHVSVEDLMTTLQGTTGFGSLRRRMQQLLKRGVPVDVPLPKVVKERLERKAGYEKTSEDISKWQQIVKKNREAPTLVFTKRTDIAAVSTAELASKFEPTTELEKEIASLLQESGLTDGNMDADKALELNKLTVREVKERQERLARMRSLLFQHEAKSKRMKKIKSKTFHRLLQKDRKTKARLDGTINDVDSEAAKEAALKQEFRRAQERMTLKHKNTSRWAKRIIKRGLKAKEDGSRDAIAEQLRTHTSLTRKVHSANLVSTSDESTDEADSASGGEEIGNDLALATKPRARLLAKSKMETLKLLEGDEEAEIPATGLFSLPFMARAIEKKRKQAHHEALAVLEQLEQLENTDDTADGFIFEEKPQDTGGTSGRLAFGAMAQLTSGSKSVRKSNTDEDLDMIVEGGSSSEDGSEDEEETATLKNSGKNSAAIAITKRIGSNGVLGEGIRDTTSLFLEVSQDLHKDDAAEATNFTGRGQHTAAEGSSKCASSNPWLFGDSKEQNLFSKASEGLKLSGGQRTKPKKQLKMGFDVRNLSENIEKNPEPLITIAGGKYVTVAGGKSMTKGGGAVNNVQEVQKGENALDLAKPSATAPVETANIHESVGSSDSEEEHENEEVSERGFRLLNGAESQAELIQRAFAGDNVEAEFEQLKAHALDEEVPQGETAVNLPGWGQWTDIQKKKGQPSWMLKEQEELKMKRDLALSKRKDAKLKYVIISEKMDKKAERFVSPTLPFPYKSREVFERSIRMPIGRDFNTDQAFRDMTRPSVVKDAGVIIDPIKYQMSESKDKENTSLPEKRGKGGKRGRDSVHKQNKIDLPRPHKSRKFSV